MGISYIYVNIFAVICFSLMFAAFCAAERSKEMNAWIALLGDMAIWAGSSLFMRLEALPCYEFWYYVSLLALFATPFLVYNYIYQFANAKYSTMRIVWFLATAALLVVSATGFILPPPDISYSANGGKVFTYNMDWAVAIPVVFCLAIIASIIPLLRQILTEKGRQAPGIKELILGLMLLALGNVVQVLPGNTFPFDTLAGIIFSLLMCTSLYKRRMFNTSLMVSSTVLMIFSAIVFITGGAFLFPTVCNQLEKYGGNIADPKIESFVLMTAALFVCILLFKKLLTTVFSEKEQQENRIKRYSDIVSKTLDIDSILRETVKVIRSEVAVNQMYICIREKDRFVPACSAMPLKPASFSIAADHPCVKYFQQGPNQLVLNEFASNPLYKSMWSKEKELFQKYDVSSICAIKDGDEVVGLLLLADKERNAAYTCADFSFINTVSSIASIAIKNAALYKQVAEREHLFSSMTEFIPYVIFIKKKGEPNFCFISANTSRVLGLPTEYFAKRTAVQSLSDCLGKERAEEIYNSMRSAPENGYYYDTPFIISKDCREITIRCAFSPIISDGRVSHYVCVVNDITADIESRELLSNSVELAKKSSNAKSEFLSHMSHEIRTPMNSIAGLTYLAREQVGKNNSKELLEYLNQIDQSSQYLLSLLNNIMDMSKIESNKFEIQAKPFNIRHILDEVYAIYGAQMSAKQIEFEFDASRVRYENLLGDELSLQKILNNLLSNAFKFTPSGGKVSLTAAQKTASDKSVVMHFEVKDTGIGMSPEFKKHIFEPYTQETAENGTKASGSGLGMAICKSMVDLQGGSISVESVQGEGTSFYIDIPYALSAPLKKDDDGENGTPDCSVLCGKRILVVDDVMINTVITGRLLEKQGVLVDCAENGKAALDMFTSHKDFYYDCILMDIQMPVMDGFEAAASIRAIKRRYALSVPIIAMTADAFIRELKNGSMNDFDGYIIKPVKPKDLYSNLVELFKNS